MKYIKKRDISEATGSGSSGKIKVPLVLAPQLWEKEVLEPFRIPVSDYVSAMNAYDSYDGQMERSKEIIQKNEKSALDKAKRAIKMFSQNDDDGNPINGYSPLGDEVPGTPEEIKRMAKIPKQEYDTVLREDLAVWFGTKKKPKGSSQPKGPWVNICRKKEGGGHPPCGRPEAESKGYPKCRAAGVAAKMTDSQKRSACAQKRKAEKTHSKIGTGNKPKMTHYEPKNESLKRLINKVLTEQYNPERLFLKDEIERQLHGAPSELKRIFKKLNLIKCENEKGERNVCVRIPEVIYVYLTGRY